MLNLNPSIPSILAVVLLAAGCAQTPPHPTGFYWGDYSRGRYAYEKAPNAQTLEAHRRTLEAIITRAEQGTVKVPPGVYAELGKLYLDQGDKTTALQWFRREVEQFPESAILMQALIEEASS